MDPLWYIGNSWSAAACLLPSFVGGLVKSLRLLMNSSGLTLFIGSLVVDPCFLGLTGWAYSVTDLLITVVPLAFRGDE